MQRIMTAMFLLTALSVAGYLAEPLAAQCDSCGGSVSRVGRVDRPAGGRAARGGTVMQNAPEWRAPSVEVLETAAREQRPIVLLFAGPNDDGSTLAGEEMQELSRSSAVFVRIPHTTDREKSPWSVESTVPVNKLLSDNPSRDYGVPVGRLTLLLCDWYGNNLGFQLSANVRAPELERMIGQVESRVKDNEVRLQRTLDRALAAHEKGDRRAAMRGVLGNFRDGFVGYAAQENTVRLYHEIMDSVRAEASALAAEGNTSALRALAREFRRTDAEKDIQEALRASS
jgi:hypothetical protein